MKQKIHTFILVIIYSSFAFITGAVIDDTKKFQELISPIVAALNTLNALEYGATLDSDITTWTDIAEKKHNGLLLISSHSNTDPSVILVDNNGITLHKWNISRQLINPETNNYNNITTDDADNIFGISDIHMYPNGDLVAIQEFLEANNFRGQKMVKLDKNSNIIWETIDSFHHEFFVDTDDKIYSLTHEIMDTMPPITTEKHQNVEFLSDVITIVSKDGKILQNISVNEAMQNSEYKHLISMAHLDIPPQTTELDSGKTLFDLLHVNSVQPVSSLAASKFDFIEASDLLISMRGPSAIAILRPSENKVIWATRGSWRNQHHVRMNDDGIIYIYDNEGGAKLVNGDLSTRTDRLITYDINANNIKVIYDSKSYAGKMSSYWRGHYKNLQDGSWIFTSPETGRILQVSENGDTIWELRTIDNRERKTLPYTKKIPSIRYYEKTYPNFINMK